MNSITNHVRAIQFTGLGEVAVRDAPPPGSPAPDEVIVAAEFLGICGSDLHVLHGHHPWVKPPLITGHELVAKIAEAGPASGFVPGERVVLNPLVSCGICRACHAARPNHCESAKVIGFRLDGAGRTRFTVKAKQLHRVPPALDPRLAALAEPLAVGLHAAGRADDLDHVLIIGGGAIGLCLLLGLRRADAGEITIAEPVGSKRALALSLGAQRAILPGEIGEAPAYTAVFDCVAAQATLDAACRVTFGGGTIVVVGVAGEARRFPLPRLQRFEINLRGSGMYVGGDIDAMIAALADHSIDPAPLISAIRPLDAAPDAYREARQPDRVKVLIDMA